MNPPWGVIFAAELLQGVLMPAPHIPLFVLCGLLSAAVAADDDRLPPLPAPTVPAAATEQVRELAGPCSVRNSKPAHDLAARRSPSAFNASTPRTLARSALSRPLTTARGSEHFEFDAGAGSYLYYSHPLRREYRCRASSGGGSSTSGRPGPACSSRRAWCCQTSIDPDTRCSCSFVMLAGAVYDLKRDAGKAIPRDRRFPRRRRASGADHPRRQQWAAQGQPQRGVRGTARRQFVWWTRRHRGVSRRLDRLARSREFGDRGRRAAEPQPARGRFQARRASGASRPPPAEPRTGLTGCRRSSGLLASIRRCSGGRFRFLQGRWI